MNVYIYIDKEFKMYAEFIVSPLHAKSSFPCDKIMFAADLLRNVDITG